MRWSVLLASVLCIIDCSFAQTPSQTSADSGGWYDTKLAASRCRAHYEYDPAGRLYWLGHYWDTLTGSTYTSQAILGQYCDYEVNTGLNRGVKLDSKYETPSSPGSSTFQISQTDSYSYDSSLDYLTGASYGDGLANANPTWSYDAAGNRNDAVTDNLNRATSIGGVTCTNDLLGNRLTSGSNAYHWDSLNRMTSYNSTTYVYRADGMRTSKSNSTGSTSYRYDGQMGMEDIDYASNGSVNKTTDYGIGARGIDAIYVTQNGASSACYPIYDAHGNMISTLTRQGTGYSTSTLRTFDTWGQIRIGAQSGDPKGRYCASLGHKQDDESSLIYMRARYYEPLTGRFISEDPQRTGTNWLIYCNNDPLSSSDYSGKTPESTKFWVYFAIIGTVAAALLPGLAAMLKTPSGLAMAVSGAAFLALWFGTNTRPSGDLGDRCTAFGVPMAILGGSLFLLATMTAVLTETEAVAGTIASDAVNCIAAYTLTIALFMALDAAQG